SVIRFGSLEDDSHFLEFYYESGHSPDVTRWATKFNAGWYQANAAVSKGRFMTGLFSQTGIGHGIRVRHTANLHRGFDLRSWAAPMTFKEEGSWKKHVVIGLELVASGGK